MRRLRRLAPALLVLLAACSDERQDIFTPNGDSADKINNLQVPVFIAAGVVGVAVAAGLIYVMISGRRRAASDADPAQVHGNFRLEIAWTILPALILAAVAVGTLNTLFQLDEDPKDPITINVYGQQWWWSYEYDLDNDGKPEIVTANDLVIPVGQKVKLAITSRDVIHSFWIPDLNGTRDAVPNRVHTLFIEADEPGVFDGQCKEFCGLSHANMKARAVAVSESEWETWLDQQQEPARDPRDPLAVAGKAVFEARCVSCHQINGVNDVEGKSAQISKHAPNLTHLMSRGVFAGALFDLYDPKTGEFNRAELEAWLRDPPGRKAMAPDEARGMPNLGLTEQEIDQLIAYLITLGPEPPAVSS